MAGGLNPLEPRFELTISGGKNMKCKMMEQKMKKLGFFLLMAGLLVLFSGSVDAQYNSRTGRQSGKTVPKILGQMKIQVRSLYSQRAGLARVVQGTIEQSTTWREGSYIRIQGEVTVGRDATLTILPGTRVDFDEGGGLYVEGELVARGSSRSPILFTSSSRDKLWERIIISHTSETVINADNEYQSGTIIENAIIERGGAIPMAGDTNGDIVLAEGGMVLVSSASPFIRNVIFRSGNSLNGGALAVVGNSRPVVTGCEFTNNRASGNGGAVYVGMNASGVFTGNYLLNNEAGRDGGAVYLSYSNALLEKNVFERNKTTRDGGAVVIGGKTPTLRWNIFRDNSAARDGDNLLVRQSEPVIEYNGFFPGDGQDAIATQPFDDSADPIVVAPNNYWGTTDPIDLVTRFFDKRVEWSRPRVLETPLLEVLPAEAPLVAKTVNDFGIYETSDFSRKLSTEYVGLGTRLFLKARGEGTHPDLVDWLFIKISSENNDSLLIMLQETAPGSNVFTGGFTVGTGHNDADHVIASDLYRTVTIEPSLRPDLAATYPVHRQKPVVEKLYLRPRDEFIRVHQSLDLPKNVQRLAQNGVNDLNHLLDDSFIAAWSYFEPEGRYQRSRRLTILNNQHRVYYTSGGVTGSAHEIQYDGPVLIPGDYTLQIEATQGVAWSEPVELRFHRNGAPVVSEVGGLAIDDVIRVLEPNLSVEGVEDPENDPIFVSLEIMGKAEGTETESLRSAWVPIRNRKIIWPFREKLADNTIYLVRFRASDGMENTEWSDWKRMVVNRENEAPGPFAFYSPSDGDELTLDDQIRWEIPIDPDPLDTLSFEVTLGPYTMSTVSDNVSLVQFVEEKDIEDDIEVSLSVAATDLEGASTLAGGHEIRVYLNLMNDPPMPPESVTWDDGATIRIVPPVISWSSAYDQDRSDTPSVLHYEIEASLVSGGRSRTFATNPGDTSIVLDGFGENQVISWKIRTLDDEYAASGWTDSRELLINATEEPPDPFRLRVPANGLETYELANMYFNWDATSDPDPGDGVTYRFVLSKDPTMSSGIVVDQVLDSTSLVLNQELENGITYYWRVQAFDKTGLGTWSDPWSFRVESTPSTPAWSRDFPEMIKPNGLLTWRTSIDPDPNDRVTYRAAFSADESFSPGSTILLNDIADIRLSFNEITNLQRIARENAPLWIRLQAVDNHGFGSDWSEARSAVVNLVNEPPTAPLLMEPAPDDVVGKRPEFTWREASDPDPDDLPGTLIYEIEIRDIMDPSSIVPGSGTQVTGRTDWRPRVALPDNREYQWRLRVMDDEGAVSPWSSPIRFIVNDKPENPSSFDLTSPGNGSVQGERVAFSWEKSEDPDPGDRVIYTFFLASSRGFSSSDLLANERLSGTRYTYNGTLEAGLTYYWKVEAVDSGGRVTSSNVFSFRVKTPGD